MFQISNYTSSRKIYKNIGMEKEIEEMLDLIWKFNEDIQKFLFPEIEFYEWILNTMFMVGGTYHRTTIPRLLSSGYKYI